MMVSLTQLFAVPMLFYLLIVMVCWLFYLVRDGAPRLVSGRNRIYRCHVCEHVYLDARDVPLARCDRCGSLNEAVRM